MYIRVSYNEIKVRRGHQFWISIGKKLPTMMVYRSKRLEWVYSRKWNGFLTGLWHGLTNPEKRTKGLVIGKCRMIHLHIVLVPPDGKREATGHYHRFRLVPNQTRGEDGLLSSIETYIAVFLQSRTSKPSWNPLPILTDSQMLTSQ
jgi:hypothetical protein